mmetsp:Transcript_10620/g.31376  ORF Transcript_10620/g.31376 Transcript_10620/m.31376 type:complete len:251 (-) Transcript_10620:327-1079(-)
MIEGVVEGERREYAGGYHHGRGRRILFFQLLRRPRPRRRRRGGGAGALSTTTTTTTRRDETIGDAIHTESQNVTRQYRQGEQRVDRTAFRHGRREFDRISRHHIRVTFVSSRAQYVGDSREEGEGFGQYGRGDEDDAAAAVSGGGRRRRGGSFRGGGNRRFGVLLDVRPLAHDDRAREGRSEGSGAGAVPASGAPPPREVDGSDGSGIVPAKVPSGSTRRSEEVRRSRKWRRRRRYQGPMSPKRRRTRER